jgi:hypothetical protein
MSWSWIVPLICGWFAVGTQSSRKSIKRAIERADRALRPATSEKAVPVSPQPVEEASTTNEVLAQTPVAGADAIQTTSSDAHIINGSRQPQPPLAEVPNEQPPKIESLIFSQRKVEDVPANERFMFLWTYHGDQLEPGPTFNYARSHLFHTFAEKVISAHNTNAQKITFNYRPWPTVLKHFLLSCLFHFIPLTGAFVIAVESPTKGLGCRSGPLIIILSASFLAALFHILSAHLSQGWCITKGKWTGYSAMLLLLLGKITAYLNAAWFLIHCHFQFIGFYKRCWCWSCRIWLHEYAYINFLTNIQKRDEAVKSWASCFAIVTAGMMVYLVVFVLEGYNLHHPGPLKNTAPLDD